MGGLLVSVWPNGRALLEVALDSAVHNDYLTTRRASPSPRARARCCSTWSQQGAGRRPRARRAAARLTPEKPRRRPPGRPRRRRRPRRRAGPAVSAEPSHALARGRRRAGGARHAPRATRRLLASLGGGRLAGAALALPAQRSAGGAPPWVLVGAGVLLGALRAARAAARVVRPAAGRRRLGAGPPGRRRRARPGRRGAPGARPGRRAARPAPCCPPRASACSARALVLAALLFVIPRVRRRTVEGAAASASGRGSQPGPGAGHGRDAGQPGRARRAVPGGRGGRAGARRRWA